MPVKNPQEHQDRFTERQLKPVDSIYVESTDSVDLDAAERIGLITDDTRAKIKEALGADHVEILKTARDRILAEGSPAIKESLSDSEKRRVALKLAFERVYGKFLLEEDYRRLSEDDPRRVFNGKFEEKMGKVLKVEIDNETGIAGRSELMSARRRLLMSENGEDVLEEAFAVENPLSPAEIDENFNDANSILRTVAFQGSAEIDEVKKLLTDSSNKSDIQKAIDILQNIHGFFDDKNEQVKIATIIEHLEKIVGIEPEVLIKRAIAKKKEAEAKVKSAESAMEYFDKKSNASETEAAINKLRKGVILVAGQPLTDADSKNIASAKSENPDVGSYSLPIKETLVELNSIIS
ncbi:MAG: hypothetical protein PHP74_02325, partial [Candidatus Gracilibacteria bacterium]|nr:hypothetical protein [Candidatus Gracilibacteria bacterium]